MSIEEQPAQTSTERGTPPLLPLRERPGLVAAFAAVGLVVGLGVAAVTPTTYTAEARLAVGSGEMSSLSIPGYPTASASMASNYARWVTTTGAGGQVLADGDVTLSASPIPESNVIRLEAESRDKDAALAAADDAASALTDEVNKVRDEDNPEKLLEQITANQPEVATAEQKQLVLANQYRDAVARNISGELAEEQIAGIEERYTAANAEYSALKLSQTALEQRYIRLSSQKTTEAELNTIQPAEISGDTSFVKFQRFGLVGLVGGLAAGFVAAHVAHSRNAESQPGRGRRRRTTEQ